MTKKKNIIFDLGGVLIDWNPDYVFKKVFQDDEKLAWFYREICTMEWNEKQDAGYPLVKRQKNVLRFFLNMKNGFACTTVVGKKCSVVPSMALSPFEKVH